MSKRLDAFTIVKGSDNKDYWHKVGVAWENRDQSINVDLFALPVSGKLHLRVPKPKEEREPGEEPGQ
jgi:hypothetical protein